MLTADTFEMYINAYCEKIDIQPQEMTALQWRGCLLFLSQIPAITQDLKYSDNSWNIDELYNLHKLFTLYALMFDKIPFTLDYSLLSGIDSNLLNSWLNKNNSVDDSISRRRYLLANAVRTSEEAALNASGSKTPLDRIQLRNVLHGYGTGRKTAALEAPTAADALPDFSGDSVPVHRKRGRPKKE